MPGEESRRVLEEEGPSEPVSFVKTVDIRSKFYIVNAVSGA